MSRALWDTIWSTDPALGTVGDWQLQPPPDPEGIPGEPIAAPYEVFNPRTGEITTMQRVLNSGGLANVDPIGTAVLLCIASDARLPDWMVGRHGFTIADQHEWHGNTEGIAPGEEPLGSLLWTLRRAPLSNYTCKLAEHFCAEALQVMIRSGVINNVEVRAEIDRGRGMIAIDIKVFGKTYERTFRHDLYALQ
jgi:phage gp46-like protein